MRAVLTFKNKFAYLCSINPYQMDIRIATTNLGLYLSSSPFERRLTALLESRYSEESFDVGAICRLLYLCPMQVHRKIKQLTGLSPGKYLLRFRLNKALSLLRSTDYSIGKIAEKTGFASHNNFARAFRREFGHSPKQERCKRYVALPNWKKLRSG